MANRQVLHWDKLKRMMVESLDKLPMPAQFGRDLKTARSQEWVGIGWIDLGPATGKEPLLVVDDEEE